MGTPGLLLVPGALLVHGDPAATAEHIRASALLFRAGVASQVAGQVLFLFVALALHRLFEPVHRNAAAALAALVIASVPIALVNVVNELATLVVVGRPQFLDAFTAPQLDALASLFLRLYGEGIGVLWVFWGLWLVPLTAPALAPAPGP